MADRYYNLVMQMLKDSGAVLVRQRVHAVWKFPDGTCWTCSQTPSDRRAWLNSYNQLRVKLGCVPQHRGLEGVRRAKPHKLKPATPVQALNATPPPLSLRDQVWNAAKQLNMAKKSRVTSQGSPVKAKSESQHVDVKQLLDKWGVKG